VTDHVLHELEVRTWPLKRAQYEAFAFSLFEGDVIVRNESHADPANHEYRVTVEDGVPTVCECPADTKYDGACKHRLAVAIRPRILQAIRRLQVAADGGVQASRAPAGIGTDASSDVPQQFDGDHWRDPVRTGRRFLPDGDPADAH
jgi:hypothetical protein